VRRFETEVARPGKDATKLQDSIGNRCQMQQSQR